MFTRRRKRASAEPECAEGQLRCYGSAPDARAWSLRVSDESELVLEAVKRGKCAYAPRLIPTRVIMDTLLAGNSKEIARLRRRIVELERPARRGVRGPELVRISSSHSHCAGDSQELLSSPAARSASITGEGRSGSPETASYASASNTSLAAWAQPCERSTNTEPSVDASLLQKEIIRRDAKMAAMQNTIEILENDICEPYTVYASINTILEKIFAILKQNKNYETYLHRLIFRNDLQHFDIKGKILVKLKVLEIFCSVITSPGYPASLELSFCSKRVIQANVVTNRKEPTDFGLGDTEDYELAESNSHDEKRTKLVAEIIASDQMLQMLCRPSSALEANCEMVHCSVPTTCARDENLQRLKHMQTCYAELANRYDELDNEKSTLQREVDVYTCGDVHIELEELRDKLKNHSQLWDEKEQLRLEAERCARVEERNLNLSEELDSCEARLMVECKLNEIKTSKLEHMTNDNARLETLLERLKEENLNEKNELQRKLEELEYECLCREQRIKSLLTQIDLVVGRNTAQARLKENEEVDQDVIETMKSALCNLRANVDAKEEEKELLQEKIHSLSNAFQICKQDVDYWKESYEEVAKHNISFEKRDIELTEKLDDARSKYIVLKIHFEDKEHEAKRLTKEINEKTQYIHQLMADLEKNADEKNALVKQTMELKDQLCRIKSGNNSTIISLLEGSECSEPIENCESYRRLRETVISCKSLHTENEYLQSEVNKKIEEIDKLRKDFEEALSCNTSASAKYKTIKENDHFELERREKEKIHLLNSLNDMRKENKELLNKLKDHKKMQDELRLLQNDYEHMKKDYCHVENDVLQKSEQINILNNVIEVKNEKIKEICINVEELQENYVTLLNKRAEENKVSAEALHVAEKKSTQLVKQLDSFQEINKCFEQSQEKQNEVINQNEARIKYLEVMCEEKDAELTSYSELKVQLNSSNHIHDKLSKEKIDLMTELNNLRAITQDREQTCESLRIENSLHVAAYEKIISENTHLKKQFKDLEQHSSVLHDNLDRITKQIDELNMENDQYRDKLSGSVNQLEQSERLILTLSEDVISRDSAVKALQNRIQELQENIQTLHRHLEAERENTEINTLNLQEAQNSITALEVNHSNVTLCMKTEIVRLNEVNSKLNSESEEYRSKISQLQNDFNLILGEVQLLKFKITKEVNTNEDSGSVELVRESLRSLSLVLEAQQLKTICLEQTLQKLQTSSELLRGKADEAKTIIEKEKFSLEEEITILEENVLESNKHEAVEKISLVACLDTKQTNTEIIEEPNEEFTAKLKNNLEDLQDLYKHSLNKITRLEENNNLLLTFTDKCAFEIEKAISSIRNQASDIKLLKSNIKAIKKEQTLVNNIDGKKSLSDITQLGSNAVRETSLHSLTDDRKLQLSKLNENEDCIPKKGSCIDSQSNMEIQNTFDLEAKELASDRESNVPTSPDILNQNLKDANSESISLELQDKNSKNNLISNDFMESINEEQDGVIEKRNSSFFRIYSDTDEDNDSIKFNVLRHLIEQVSGSEEIYAEIITGNELSRYDNKEEIKYIQDGSDVFDVDNKPTHEWATDEELRPHRLNIQNMFNYADLSPQMRSSVDGPPSNAFDRSTFNVNMQAEIEYKRDSPIRGLINCEFGASESFAFEEECGADLEMCNMKIGVMKEQYSRNARRMVREHEAGVISLQRLHEQSVRELRRRHRAELDACRSAAEERARRLADVNAQLVAQLPPRDGLAITTDSPPQEVLKMNRSLRQPTLSITAVQTFECKPEPRRRGTEPPPPAVPRHRQRARGLGHGHDACSVCHAQLVEKTSYSARV